MTLVPVDGHGLSSRYGKGCRCAPCTEAQRRRMMKVRQRFERTPRSQVPHGVGGYNNYRCRCVVCKAAKSASNRAHRAARGGLG